VIRSPVCLADSRVDNRLRFSGPVCTSTWEAACNTVSVSAAIVQQIVPQLDFASIVRAVALDGRKPDRQIHFHDFHTVFTLLRVYFLMMYRTEFCSHVRLANRCEATLHRCTTRS